MPFTKQHADENRQMAELGDRLTTQGVTDYNELRERLAEAFPHVPPHRIRSAAARALRRWRGRIWRQERK